MKQLSLNIKTEKRLFKLQKYFTSFMKNSILVPSQLNGQEWGAVDIKFDFSGFKMEIDS